MKLIIRLFLLVGPHNSNTMEVFIGLDREQFEQVCGSVSQSLLRLYKDATKARISLYIYLMKLRTNHTNKQIAAHFELTHRTISTRIREVREIVHKDFVSKHVLHRSRAELLRNTTQLSRDLYEKTNQAVITLWDATYVFTIKSSNYQFQKDSFSVQKKRNLVKVMLCVMTNGLVAGVYGPYSAKKNDASILNELLDRRPDVFNNFNHGDVMVLDRGFRDSVAKAKSHGFDVKIPTCNNPNQLSTKQANQSRLVTKVRFMIEARNTHIKNKWKYLSAVKNVESLPTLFKDFEVCVALVNAFCDCFQSDKNDFELIGKRMLELRDLPNRLSNHASKIPRNAFKKLNNLTLFPKLTFADLKYISLGTYQITQARSYVQRHMNSNQNRFVVGYCSEEECRKLCGKIGVKIEEPALIYLKLQSRFQSTKHHNTYVLVDLKANGKDVVIAHCCSCKNGLRTIGCCSHIMSAIWYIYYVDHSKPIKFPSPQLETVFLQDQDSDSDAAEAHDLPEDLNSTDDED